MRLIAVSMIRNEADILPDFLGHCAALFDELLVVDHASTDGTSEMLAAAAEMLPVTVWRFAHRAKMQSRIMSALAREAVARGADWVFPLDADEFPPVASRDALCALLDGAGPLQAWRWRNLWPGADAAFGSCRLRGQHETAASRTRKIALARGLFASDPRLRIGEGSHGAHPLPAGLVAEERLGELLHVPVRSAGRLRLKIATNLVTLADTPGRQARHGWQYERSAGRMDALTGEDPGLRRRLALGYPHVAARDTAAAAVLLEFSPARRIEGLPEPTHTEQEVVARDAALRWQALPEGAPQSWHVSLQDGEARLSAR